MVLLLGMSGGALYIAGVFVVSLIFNVPMNSRLDAKDYSGSDAAAYWSNTYPLDLLELCSGHRLSGRGGMLSRRHRNPGHGIGEYDCTVAVIVGSMRDHGPGRETSH